MLAVAAMAGALVGAVCGAALGAEDGEAFSVFYGTLGTMLGSALATGVWYLFVRLLSSEGIEHNQRAGQNAAAPSRQPHLQTQQAFTPTPSAG